MLKPNKHPFIVLEGIDGSGKTTVGKMLAKRMDGIFYQTPSRFWRKNRHLVEDRNVVIRFMYYYLANVFSAMEVRKILKTKTVICDRYVYSTWAHHIIYGLPFLRRVSPFFVPFILKKPDKTFYLYVSRAEREKRISGRTGNTLKDNDSDTLDRTQEEFLKLSDMRVIDTSSITPEKIVEIIIKNLSSGK